MRIDAPTLLLTSGAVIVISTISFVVNTVLRRNDIVARMWTVAFVSGILTSLSYAIWSVNPQAWWAVAVGNGEFVFSIGALWCGCRLFNERRSFLWVPLVAALVVLSAALARGPHGGAWAGSLEMFVGVAAFGTLAAVETRRANLSRSVTARVLTVVFAFVSVYYVFRAVWIVIDGPTGPVFTAYFGTIPATFVTIFLVILGAISTSILAVGRQSGQRVGTRVGLTRQIPGVVGELAFQEAATDWLARAKRDRDSLVLVIFEIANIDHMNTAFGREYGDQAIYAVGRIACQSTPSASLVCHFRGARFAILTTAPAVGEAELVAEHLHTSLVETPIDPIEGIRAIATCGLATTEHDGYDFADLRASALAALSVARFTGPGTIRLTGSITGP
jgi:diguanylate cyclase (GGDEF)-like protein